MSIELQTLIDRLSTLMEPVPNTPNTYTIYSPNQAAGCWLAIRKQATGEFANRWSVALYCTQGLIKTINQDAAGPNDAISIAALWLKTTDRVSWFLTEIGLLEAQIIAESYPSQIGTTNCIRYDHEFSNGIERFFVITTQVSGATVYYNATEQTGPNPDRSGFAGWTSRGTDPSHPYQAIAEYLQATPNESWDQILDARIAADRRSAAPDAAWTEHDYRKFDSSLTITECIAIRDRLIDRYGAEALIYPTTVGKMVAEVTAKRKSADS